jgi:ribosomal protein L36
VGGNSPGASAVDNDNQQESWWAMHVRNSLKSLKKAPGSQVVRRRGRTFVINSTNPRMKARQG